MEVEDPNRFGHHRNAFGFLRLLFASLVILSHTPELVDGNRSREILTRCFGTLSFGELAVDGFFIISGLLISASFLASKTIWTYLLKRIARIYPAFVICSVICVTLVATLGGATEGSVPTRALQALVNAILLRLPDNDYGAFAGSYYPMLNGASWTIAYEFRCYLLVILLGLGGLLERPLALAGLTLACLIGGAALSQDMSVQIFVRMKNDWHLHPGVWLGEPREMLRLAGLFLAGATFRSCQQQIPLRLTLMMLSGVALVVTMLFPFTAEIGVAVFGSYLIFGAAALGRGTILERVNNRNDVSYGLYLYAWPIEKLLIAAGLGSSLILLGVSVWLGALALGALSWFAIERPIMRWVRPTKAIPQRPGSDTFSTLKM